MASRNYTDEEVEAIFRRALERQAAEQDGLGHQELIAAAREVGLEDTAVEKAIREIEETHSKEEIRKELAQKKRASFVQGLLAYLVIAGGLLGLHYLVNLVGLWVWWVAFGWGIGVFFDALATVRGPTEAQVEREVDKRNREARRKAAAEARRARQRARKENKQAKSQASEDLERVIEEGVGLLLNVAAQKIREASQRMNEPPAATDFGRFVDAKKGRVPSGGGPSAPRVRVDVKDGQEEEETVGKGRSESSRRRSR